MSKYVSPHHLVEVPECLAVSHQWNIMVDVNLVLLNKHYYSLLKAALNENAGGQLSF